MSIINIDSRRAGASEKHVYGDTLEDVRRHAFDNISYIFDKKLVVRRFSELEGLDACNRYIMHLYKTCMDQLGVGMLFQNLSGKSLQKAIEKRGIEVVERRNHYKGDVSWRNGLYIRKGNEIVGFISFPHKAIDVVWSPTMEWEVRTNIKC